MLGRVYITDDEAMIRRMLKKAFDLAGFKTRTFECGQSLLQKIDELEPGVIILDIRMKGMNGLDVLDAMKKQTRRHAVLMLTGNYDVVTAVKAIHGGAIDFVEKPASPSYLIARVKELHGLVDKWSSEYSLSSEASLKLDILTSRENEVVQLLAMGHSSKEIAKNLGLSPRTIEAHRARIMKKLDAGSTAEIVRLFTISSFRNN